MAQNISISNFSDGLNTAEATTIDDNQLAVAKNVYYDNQKILSTRKGIANFGTEITGLTGQSSIYFTRFSDETRHLLLAAGTKIYKYNETTTIWDELKTGLTTGLDYSFVTYKDKTYITNGTDNFMYYNGTTITDVPAVSKVKFLAIDKDVIYGAGKPGSGNSAILLYTNAGDELTSADFAHFEYIDRTTEGIITSLNTFTGLPTVGTDKGVYTVNVFGTSVAIDKTDYNGDVSSNRSVVNVENDQFFMSSRGYYSLSQRQGTTGSFRATSFTTPIQKNMDYVIDKSTVAAHYYKKTNNIYVSVNSGGSRNNTLFVYSVLASDPGNKKYVWTEYENINANDFTEYIDASGISHLLVANSFGGQVIEIETGFTDNGTEILSTIHSKIFDFQNPEMLKTFSVTDLGGLISRQQDVTFGLDIDGVETNVTFSGGVYAIGDSDIPLPLGTEPLGEDPLGGGSVSVDGIVLSPFVRRRYPYTTGHRLQYKLVSRNSNSAWKMTKIHVEIEPQESDVFYNDYIS